jgi:hypothetical protein
MMLAPLSCCKKGAGIIPLFYYNREPIEEPPRVSAIQIEKMAQEDIFVKLLALLQVLSIVVQFVSRQVLSLPSAPLERAALAFVVASTITYILYWRRP